jgi:acyl-CoA thioesterase FadM
MKLPKLTALDIEGLAVTHRQEIPQDYRDEFGHMNVMWYTHLFSVAFGKFGEQFGYTEEYFRSREAGSFALETHVRYLAEVQIGRHVTVRSRAIGRTAKRLHFMHFMTIDETGAMAATQEHVAAHIDMRVRRMAPLAGELAERFDRLVEAHNRLGWEPPVCGIMRP